MGRGDDGKRVTVHQEAPRGGGTSLGDLLRKAGLVPPQAPKVDAPREAAPKVRPAPPVAGGDGEARVTDLSACGKVVLRRERKGHEGRTVTRIEGLGMPQEALERLGREVAKAMGCGARAEEDVVVVQGEPGDRLDAWLTARGVRKVVRGN
jgi:translation initiation factor 1